jgi:hypothetical protein
MSMNGFRMAALPSTGTTMSVKSAIADDGSLMMISVITQRLGVFVICDGEVLIKSVHD